MPENNAGDRFGGMPDDAVTSNATKIGGSFRRKWTLPKKAMGLRWGEAALDDMYRTFWLEELTPEMQHAAAKVSKDNASVLQQEMLFRAVVQIGDKRVGNDRDFKELWYKAIGPRCRMLLSSAFGDMVSVDEADTEAFLASGTSE